jgi:hypothetical protein
MDAELLEMQMMQQQVSDETNGIEGFKFTAKKSWD